MQTFMGPIFIEGVLTSGMMAIGRSLTEPEVWLRFIFSLMMY
jgi:transformation/transcription domain-associated protein